MILYLYNFVVLRKHNHLLILCTYIDKLCNIKWSPRILKLIIINIYLYISAYYESTASLKLIKKFGVKNVLTFSVLPQGSILVWSTAYCEHELFWTLVIHNPNI
jgi:hypothetical protein